jgi:hypothetical protein
MALRAFVGAWPLFSFLILHTVGRTPWTGDEPVAWSLPTHRTQTQNERTQTSMPRVWFEPTTPVFGRAKTVHALDRTSIVIGDTRIWDLQNTMQVLVPMGIELSVEKYDWSGGRRAICCALTERSSVNRDHWYPYTDGCYPTMFCSRRRYRARISVYLPFYLGKRRIISWYLSGLKGEKLCSCSELKLGRPGRSKSLNWVGSKNAK